MAEQSFTALKELSEQLMCGICLNQYTTPKTLQCLHSFCLKCIEKLPQHPQGDQCFVSCPSCRKPTQIPDIGAIELPTAFLINSLFQVHSTLAKASKHPNCDNCRKNSSTGYCQHCTRFLCPDCLDRHNGWQPFSSHEVIDVQDVAINTSKILSSDMNRNMMCIDHNEPLKVYCETCQQLICRDCTISQCHHNHMYKLVTECYADHHQEIKANLTAVKKKITEMNAAVANLITRQKEVAKQGEDVVKEIHTQAQLFINVVQQSERQLVQQVDTAVQQKIQLLTKQREKAEAVLNQLKNCEEIVEQSLKVGSQQLVLREKKSIVQVLTTVKRDVNPIVFQPIEDANITFIKLKLVDGIGHVKSETFGKSVLVKSVAGRRSTITLKLLAIDESAFSIPPYLFSCELSSASSSQSVACDINETQSGNYDISFNPCTEGKHQLIVRLGGIDISCSPFTLPPEMRKSVNIIPGLNRPYGVVVAKNGEIILAENWSGCITILSKEGEKLRSFGSKGKKEGDFTFPRGVAISHDAHILVTDDHRVQKLTFEGVCVKSVGSNCVGNGPLQFYHPRGIKVHPTTRQIFIADSENHRVQVLNSDFTYSHSFGKEGSAPDQFSRPMDVAFDNDGFVYVADRYNHCIKKFTSGGQFISKLCSEGSNPGQLKQPSSIFIDKNSSTVFISEKNKNCVSIFDTKGVFIRCFGKKGSGEEEFNHPLGIAVDSLGKLYITDFYNNRLVLL